MTTIKVRAKDRDYLLALTKKLRKAGIWAVVEDIINLIKHQKLELELK